VVEDINGALKSKKGSTGAFDSYVAAVVDGASNEKRSSSAFIPAD
jgi:hypothetical protein